MAKETKPVVEVKLDAKEPVKVEKPDMKKIMEAYEKQNPVKAKAKADKGWLELK